MAAPKGKEILENEIDDCMIPNYRLPISSNNLGHLPPEIELLQKNDNDNDFFHITCHIDPNLQAKIERGKFIKLDKLLPKGNGTAVLNDDNRVELVNRDSATFFTPVHNRDMINSVRKWQQAFHVYAARKSDQNMAICIRDKYSSTFLPLGQHCFL